MKNTLIYAPLHYRPSLLSEKQATIGLLFYEKNEGNIEFISGENELLRVKDLSPNAKISLFKVYIDVIQQKIKKNPPEKGLNQKEIHAYLDKNVLSLDDSSLQFGEIGAVTNLNGNVQEKKAFYEKKFLGEGANGRENGQKKKAQIYYFSLTDEMRKEEKLQWFRENALKNIAFEKITPDKNGNWLHLSEENDWEDLLPICSKEKKENAIFQISSLGISTNRDEWVYDFSKENLESKISCFIDKYNDLLAKNDFSWDTSIKWSEYLKGIFKRKQRIDFDAELLIPSNYRPFTKKFHYAENFLNDRLTQNHYDIFGDSLNKENFVINLNKNGVHINYFASNKLSDLHFLGDNQCLPLFRYENGERKENISDWVLEQFRAHYEDISISKENIFHYVYAVLHNPAYRSKYELNLKREFPRIPFYTSFWKWAKWGQDLMALHIDYETVAPYALVRKDAEVKPTKKQAKNLLADTETPNPLFEEETAYIFVPKPKLKANKEEGKIEIDEITTLSGVPSEAWEYKLGNRSALEWVLDQYKESKPSDATIAEHFNSYKFADYKESVIELLMRVCTVSVETVRIVSEMSE